MLVTLYRSTRRHKCTSGSVVKKTQNEGKKKNFPAFVTQNLREQERNKERVREEPRKRKRRRKRERKFDPNESLRAKVNFNG
jgi:hypothetical protein